MIITIDGVAGTGKTSVARGVAKALGFAYVDTGAMYRAVAYLALKEGLDCRDEKAIGRMLDHFSFEVRELNGERCYFVCGQDVTYEIRSQEVSGAASALAVLRSVREALWRLQREAAKRGNVVFEGRDMGSVVFPQADVKIFLLASPEIRAERRLRELVAKGLVDPTHVDASQMLSHIVQRDALDSSRELAPLVCPEDAYVIDTSALSIEQVVGRIVEYAKTRSPRI